MAHPYLRTLVFVLASIGRCAMASDFKVTTTVSSGSSVPISRTTTLFGEQKAYDFIVSPTKSAGSTVLTGEVMVMDLADRNLTLLSVESRTKTTVTFAVLEDLAAAISAEAVTDKHSPLVRFAAAPTFERTWTPKEQQLQLSSDLVTYISVLSKPEDQAAVLAYRVFADASARLATMAPGMPAQARLELNRQIAEAQSIPVEVSKQLGERMYTSRHEYVWELTDQDQAQIAQITRLLSEAETVGFVDYLSSGRR